MFVKFIFVSQWRFCDISMLKTKVSSCVAERSIVQWGEYSIFIVEMYEIFSVQYLDKIGTNFFGIAQSKSANTGNALGM